MESLKINTETITLVDLVEESLLKYIKEKNLKPGDRLLHEEELSEQLGVGRNVVREALSRLRSLGILDSRKRRGIVLQEPDIRKNLEKLINPQMLGRDTIIDLLELRYTLELGIIPTLLNRITMKISKTWKVFWPKKSFWRMGELPWKMNWNSIPECMQSQEIRSLWTYSKC